MAVQVDGVTHHGVIDQGDADALVSFETDRLDQFAEFAPVEAPHEPLHIARQMDLQGSGRCTAIVVGLQRDKVGIDQHPVVHVPQAQWAESKVVGGCHGDHVDPDSHGHLRRRIVRIAHVHSAVIHGRRGTRCCGSVAHRGVVHACHVAVVHSGHGAHAHVGHGQGRDLSQRRNLGGHP